MSMKRIGDPLSQICPSAKRARYEEETIAQKCPEDCLKQIVILSGSAPVCSGVCKSWRRAAERAYPFVLDIYALRLSHFMPKECGSAFEAVKRTYLAVMRGTNHIPQVRAVMARLDRSITPLARPLVLGPVVKTAEDINLVQFFSQLDLNERPGLKGTPTEQAATIRAWMKGHQASLDQITDINLDSANLSILPPEIGHLKNLEELSVENNKLSTLPSEIGHLKNLRGLFLGGNLLDRLPLEISELRNLDSLVLPHIHLTDLQQHPLPEEVIANLSTLNKIIGAFKEGKNGEALKMFKEFSTETKSAMYEVVRKIDSFQNSQDVDAIHAFLELYSTVITS